jgi:plastocyanin
MLNDAADRFLFDPIGLLIAPGQTVRWVLESGVHSTTAYHPSNFNQSLRIPDAATPWDSGVLVEPGETLDVTLTVPGVYDYYCLPHETVGMVGRIIVGEPTGPGSLPFDYFTDRPDATQWRPIPVEARAAFPSIERILDEKVVHPPSE